MPTLFACEGDKVRVQHPRTKNPVMWENAVVHAVIIQFSKKGEDITYRVRLTRLAENTGREVFLNVKEDKLKLPKK